MAGSYDHCLTEDRTYRGTELLENMHDMGEAVQEMFFMIGWLTDNDPRAAQFAANEYYKCVRGEKPWPDWMRPGVRDMVR